MRNQTAFYEACSNGDTARVKTLLNKKKILFFQGLLADEPEVKTGCTGIQLAAEQGHLGVVQILAQHGVDTINEERSAFYLAALKGHTDIVKYLLTMIDIEAKESELKGAFDVAFERGHSNVVDVIRQERPFSEWGDAYEYPFHEAIQQRISDNKMLELLELILKAGHNINEKNQDGWSPLHFAANLQPGEGGEIISWLLEAGAAVDAMGIKGRKPIFFSVANKDEIATNILLAAGADNDEVDIEEINEYLRSMAAPAPGLHGSTVLWNPGPFGPLHKVVLDLPDWQFDWVTNKQPIFWSRNSTDDEIAEAKRQCELEIGLISKHRESAGEQEETPLETVLGLAFYKVTLGYAIANYLDFHTAQGRISAPERLKKMIEENAKRQKERDELDELDEKIELEKRSES